MKYTYSYSRLNLYENCHAAFKYKVIDKIAELSNTAATTGIICHQILEEYVTFLISKKQRIDFNYLIELISRATTEATINIVDDIKLIMNNTSESFLLPEYDNFCFPEKRYAFNFDWELVEWNNPDVFIRGIMDLTWDKNGCLYFEDFKTSRKILSESEVKNNFQILLYALMLYKINQENIEKGIYKSYIICRINFIRYGVVREIKISIKKIQYIEKKIYRLISQIENTKLWRPSICQYCDWCSFQSVCTLYKKHLKNFNFNPKNIYLLAKKVYIAEQFIKSGKKILKGHVDNTGAITVDNMVLDFYPEEKKSFNTLNLINKFKEHKIDYLSKLSFNKSGIISLTKGNKKLRQELLDTAVINTQTKFKFKKK